MKETTIMVLLFIFAGVYSGAVNITTTVIFMIIEGFLIYVAWGEEKKETLKRKELIIMRKERLARRNLN